MRVGHSTHFAFAFADPPWIDHPIIREVPIGYEVSLRRWGKIERKIAPPRVGRVPRESDVWQDASNPEETRHGASPENRAAYGLCFGIAKNDRVGLPSADRTIAGCEMHCVTDSPV